VSILLCTVPARAAIVVSIAEVADRDARFLVQTKSNHALIHGSQMKDIDERFLRPGETARITVLALNPLTFSFVYSAIYHPAYRYDSQQVKTMPSLIRTVRMPEFEPRAWRDFIDAGEPVLYGGKGTHLGHVVDHFRLFLKEYLPAIDAAGGGDDLRQYIPLFEDIIRHARQTMPQTMQVKAIQGLPDQQLQDRLQAIERHALSQFRELEDDLAEIKTLLSVSAQERIRLRSLQAKCVDARSVYHELMDAHDRQQIEAFLDFQYENHHARPDKTRQWLSDDGQIRYAITLGDHYTLRDRDHQPLYDSCYRTGLGVDLHGGKPTLQKDTQKTVTAGFCRSGRGEWLIQLPRR